MPEWVVAPWYWANIHTWATALVHLNARVQVQGLEHVPRRGPLIVASNHLSLADPPIITAVVPRRIVWMAKKELFDIPGLGLAFHLFGCLPVRRFEADLGALREARRVLERGLALGMFPEGTRSGRPGMNRAWPGTALLALQTGAPVLPVGIMGSEHIRLPGDIVAFLRLRRYPVRVVIGRPFTLPRPERLRTAQVERATEAIMARIAGLLDPPYRGVYARVVAEAMEGKE
ncbi:1-acyl-sn-glycerol-3-phosphate acyltransferase [bacterium HR24]|nr:1-acyl-sn-glycerol-3-phosphate acyltransferase [bacterium HR24]